MKIWGRVVEQSGCMVDLQSKGPTFKSHLLTKLWLNCQRNSTKIFVLRVFIRHWRSENSLFIMQNSVVNIPYSLRPFFYSDMEPLLKYSPVRLHLSPLLEFLMKTMCSGPRFGYAPWLACSNSHCRLPIMLKWNLKFIFSNSLSPLGTQNKDLNTASQTLLTKVTLHLQCRLPECGWIFWGSREFDSSAIHQFSLLNSQLIF